MHSVANAKIDRQFIPRFILRRSIRIDPPYWCAIIIAIILMLLKNQIFPAEKVELPSFSTIIAHIFYLQDVLGLQAISAVFWTLCLEFQFYLIFSFFYYFYVRMDESKKRKSVKYFISFSFITCLLSPVFRFSSTEFIVPGTILPYAYEFALGVLGYFWVKGYLGFPVIIIAVACAAATTAIYKPIYYIFIPLAVLIVVFFSSKGNFLSFMKSKVMLFLGKISYSFYLIHASVGWVSISFMMYLASGQQSEILTVAIFFAGIGFSIIVSVIFNNIIEVPSLRLSKKFRAHNDLEKEL
jgi:peptidoglycan/LPS O-acetylase OafA/YrhL